MEFGADYRFDLDLRKGEIGEKLLASVLGGDTTIEVKRDFIVSTTGNIAIEYKSRGKDSGIITSEAEWWAFVLSGPHYEDEVIVLIRRKRLKALLDCLYRAGNMRVDNGGDEGTSRIVLLPLGQLMRKMPPSDAADLSE